MVELKRQRLQELSAARDELWRILDALDTTTEIYPGWKKREFLAHIAGWEAMVFDVIHRQLSQQAPNDYGYTDIDNANDRFVAVHQTTTVQDAQLECEINRFAIQTLLDSIEDFNDVIHFPWGTTTVTEWIQGAIEHEYSHGADIIKLTSLSTSLQAESR